MKKLICIILSFMMLFSFLSISTVVSATEIIYGDVNDDGVLNSDDAMTVKDLIKNIGDVLENNCR